ncbi:MAG: hypothetical protein GX318_05200 [Clostridia bacterium]|nr:hypothetical protein [Clostridia bacterium]
MEVIDELVSWWKHLSHWRPVYSTHDTRMFSTLVYKLEQAGIRVKTDVQVSENRCPLQENGSSEICELPFYTVYVPEKYIKDAEELIFYLN